MGFAKGLSGLGAKDVHMITMPVEYDPADPNRVIPLKAAAQQVWTALKQDKPIPASAIKDSAGDKGDAGTVVEPVAGSRCPERTPQGNSSGPTPVLGDTAGPGRLVRRPRFTYEQSARATRCPPETRRHLEARHPPRVRRDPGQLHLWRVVHHP